jgi:hypothetical protein
VSSRQSSWDERISGGVRRTLNTVLVLRNTQPPPRNPSSFDGGRASRVCIVTATSIANSTRCVHVSMATANARPSRTRWFAAVTRLRSAESCTPESHSAVAERKSVPSGRKSSVCCCRSGSVTRSLDVLSCTRPLASSRRMFPTQTFVTSIHGSCQPDADEGVRTMQRWRP